MRHIPRFFITQKPDSMDDVLLPDWHNLHVSTVLRMRVGDDVVVFSQEIGEWAARLVHVRRDKVVAKCYKQIAQPVVEDRVGVAFGVVKNSNINIIVEKCTELGVTDFYPIITDYTNNKVINIEKLQKIAIFAAEQCGRISVPVCHNVQTLISLLEQDFTFFTALERKKCDACLNFPRECCFIVGPEGGFSEREVIALKEKTTVLTLSHNVLRTETAAIACLSAFNFMRTNNT